jgi:gliding motility-associated-like protein
MSVVAENPQLTKVPTDIELEEIATNRYWKLDVGQGAAPATILALSDRDTDTFFQSRSGVIVEAVNEGGTATNLSSQSSSDGFISSERPISTTARVFTFARLNTLIAPQIHNAITPNNDGINDFLVIRDIRFYATDNKVTLIDRWGVTVKQWTNFSGFDPITNPPDFDFGQLSNGNYICTMEYNVNGERKNVRQMITVIK